MEPDRSPAQLIAQSEGLLLDFDGPVCNVYAGSDPARIARQIAAAFNLDIETDDPLDLIGHALAIDGPVDELHQALTNAEIETVGTATETPGIRQLVKTYGRPIAIVSNNGRQAIETWLARSRLDQYVAVVIGRDPRHMKPDPQPLQLAADRLGMQLTGCVFVGDSTSDALAADRAGVPMVALANRPHKRQLFSGERCAAIINSIHELTSINPVFPRTA